MQITISGKHTLSTNSLPLGRDKPNQQEPFNTIKQELFPASYPVKGETSPTRRTVITEPRTSIICTCPTSPSKDSLMGEETLIYHQEQLKHTWQQDRISAWLKASMECSASSWITCYKSFSEEINITKHMFSALNWNSKPIRSCARSIHKLWQPPPWYHLPFRWKPALATSHGS